MTLTSTNTVTKDQQLATDWVVICPADRIVPDRGVAALVDGAPVAIFRLTTEHPDHFEWCVISHIDPANGMPVMARGLVGSADLDGVAVPTVASPLLKQRYDLRTGRCLDGVDLAVESYSVRVVDGLVEVGTKSRC